MTQSLRQIKRRIRSIENTKKVTRALQMVSTAKFKRHENMLYSSRPYYVKLDSILNEILSSVIKAPHPLTQERTQKRNFALCIITSDSGLCSTYNDNIIRLSENFINEHGIENTKLITIGRKGFSYFKKHGAQILYSYVSLHGRFSAEIADGIAKKLIDIYISQEADEVYFAHMHFDATMRYKPKLEKFLNIKGREELSQLEYIAEPNIDKILDELIPRYLSVKIRLLFLDAFTSEHSQRMIAMKTATDNAVELIDKLTLLRNKARQESITKEVIEVSSAAQAL